MTIDEAKAALRRIHDEHTYLSAFGVAHYAGHDTVEKRLAHFVASRQELLDSAAMFIASCEYIAAHPFRKTLSRKGTSYGRKHRAERWRRDRGDSNPYVSNGVFIAACLHMGVEIRQVDPRSPNVFMALGAHRDWADCPPPQPAALPAPLDDLDDLLG